LSPLETPLTSTRQADDNNLYTYSPVALSA